MKTGVIYARYSSDRQTEQSIEGQLRECNAFAEANKIVIVDTYIDRAMTGTNDNRDSFQQMLKDSYKKAWDYVIVYKLDRFSRNKYETAIHKKTLRDNGIKILSAKENIPDTPEGIILESLLEGMAEYYSAELSQKVKRGMKETRIKGNFTGGRVTYGYKVENKKVVVNEEEANVIRTLFNEFIAGRLVTDILQEFKNKNITYRGKDFGRNTLYSFLRTEKFIGKYTFDGETYTNIYPPIVSEEIFEIARNKIEGNKYGKHKPVTYLLKCKLQCGYCGNIIQSEAGTSKMGHILRYYKCTKKKVLKEECESKQIKKEALEELVVNAVYSALSTNKLIDELAETIIDLHHKQEEDNSHLIKLYREKANVEKSITNVLTAIDKGIITQTTKKHLEDLEKQQEELSQQIAFENSKEKLTITKDDILKYLKLAITKKPKQMLDLLVKKIIVYNDKIEIYFKYNGIEDELTQHETVYEENTTISAGNYQTIQNDINVQIKI